MNSKRFWKKYCYNDPMKNIFPKGTDAQLCLNILVEHFLGYTPILNYSGSTAQWNSEVTALILEQYPEGKTKKIPKSKPKRLRTKIDN